LAGNVREAEINWPFRLGLRGAVKILTSYKLNCLDAPANGEAMAHKRAESPLRRRCWRKKSRKKKNYTKFKINQPTRCNSFSSLLLDVYVQLNMFRAFSRPSSGAQQLQ
jgi:hypothetical protein